MTGQVSPVVTTDDRSRCFCSWLSSHWNHSQIPRALSSQESPKQPVLVLSGTQSHHPGVLGGTQTHHLGVLGGTQSHHSGVLAQWLPIGAQREFYGLSRKLKLEGGHGVTLL